MNANYISKTENSRQLIAVFEGKKEMAGVTGLEPAASGVTGQRSNHLSYAPVGRPAWQPTGGHYRSVRQSA